MGRRSSFSLSNAEVSALEDFRLGAQSRGCFGEDKRARALLLVGRDGMTRREAAEICEFSERTIPSPGRPSRLSADEKVRLAELIANGPEAAG